MYTEVLILTIGVCWVAQPGVVLIDPARERNRGDEIKQLTSQGIIPVDKDVEDHPEKSMEARRWLMGQVAALIHVR